MRISSMSGTGASSSGRRAQIERKIRTLEERKRELQKKMRGDGDNKAETQPLGLTKGTASIKQVQPATQAAAYAPITLSDSNAEGAAVPEVAVPTPDMLPDNGSAMQELSQAFKDLRAALGGNDSGGGGGDMGEDMESLMKRIQTIDLQIMSLQQQLEDTDIPLQPMEMPEEGEVPVPQMQGHGHVEVAEAELPTAEVVDGHVDGYV